MKVPEVLRGRRWPSAVGAVTAPAVLIGLALVYPGAVVSQVYLNDGAVWLTDGTSQQVGRWNPEFAELDATAVSQTSQFDVLQDGESVLLIEGTSIAPLDPATVAIGTRVPVQDAAVSMSHGVVSIMGADGDLWVRSMQSLAGLDLAAQAPDVELGPGASAVVSSETGTVWATTADGQVHEVTAGEQVTDRVAGSLVGDITAADQTTTVGDTLVTLTGATVHTPSAEVDLAAWGDTLKLQQPGEAAQTVLVATPTSLLEVPLDGSQVTEHSSGGSGAPANPVRVAGCAHGAWATAVGSYLRVCSGAEDRVDLAELTAAAVPVFRVNRDVVVLNDTTGGNVWSPLKDPKADQPNWTAFVPQEDQTDGDDSDDQPSTTTLQTECTPQSAPPQAVDDDLGARPGRTTILSVIDNDVSSDCGILAISEMDEIDPEFATAALIYGGRAIELVTTPQATGTISFTYTVTDGRGTSAPSTATVTVTARPDSVNKAPEQTVTGQLAIELGATGTYYALPDFVDADGDQLVLVEATAQSGVDVRARQDGQLTVISDGSSLGRHVVDLVVSDGRQTVAGQLVVEVRPPGSLEPVIDPVHATTYVGQTVTVSPLDSVRSASREPVRLAGVDEISGVTITTDLAGGTFTFTAARAGTYYVSFVVTAAPQQATGLARIDVADQPDSPPPPIAVLDAALLPAGGEVVVDPLSNDVDPAGGVLVLQSVDVPPSSGLEVAVLSHQLVRISATRALTEPIAVPYTISNGIASATGELRVKPIESAAGQQPPVVPDASATVRAGGVVTIPVLEGAYDPDGDALTLDPVLASEPAAGLLFASGDVLRFLAPSEPMRVEAVVTVTDSELNTTAATITIDVHASSEESKAPPTPKDLTARVFESETIRIPVPLTGIDPDGDDITLLGQDTAPVRGRIVAQGADWLEYEALPGETGTDTFTYAVEDWVGQRAVATIRVGIAARPTVAAQVVSRDDEVTVRPGQSVSVRVLANDVDMSGGDLTVDDVLEMADGIDAAVENGRRIVVTTPGQAGVLQIAYTARNDRGGSDSAVLTVLVDPDAPIRPPVARDVVVPAVETLNALSVEVNVLEVAENPSGPLSDLAVSVSPSFADVAEVNAAGNVVVTLSDRARTLPYQLTNTAPEAGGASAYAFISVPALGDFPPIRRPGADRLVVLAGDQLIIRLGEQVQVAPGRSPRLVDEDSVSATKSDGSPLVVNGNTLSYTAQRSYAGPASITVEVSDGAADDPGARTAVLTLPITVLAFEDHPPTFTPSVLDVGPGETTRVNLTAFTSAPVGTSTETQRYSYTLTSEAPAGFTVGLNGSELTLTAAPDVPRGTVGGVGLSIDYGGLGVLAAQIDFRVVASSRPLARVLDHRVKDGVDGRTSTVNVLAGAFNPFPGSPLTVVAASVESGLGDASVADSSTVSVRPSVGFVGPMTVRYAVRDVTGDADREVEGRITVVVRAVPEAPDAPRIGEVGDGTVTLSWGAPVANGEPITSYRVTASPGGNTTQCPSTTCTVSGLTNDVEYTFTVTATNAVGESEPSAPSGRARPDVRPAAPAAPSLEWGTAAVTATWVAPASSGSPISEYQVEVSPAPPSGPAVLTTASTKATFTGLVNGTSYTVRVRAVNGAIDPSDWSPWSAAEIPAAVPSPPGDVKATRDPVNGSSRQITVTWTAPAANGNAISRYEVKIDGTVIELPVSQTSYQFQAALGHTYTIDVRAVNKAGPSSWASTTGEIWSAPGPVINLSAVDDGEHPTEFGHGVLLVSWDPPSDSGGVALTGYRVSIDGGTAVSTTSTSRRFTGLAGGTHWVSVTAVNTKGAVSTESTVWWNIVTVPQRPTIAEPADTSEPTRVTFSWQPGGDGGSPIRDYFYVVEGDHHGTQSGTVPGTSLTVFSDPGETLTLTVSARNDEGTSVVSVPVSAVVAGP